MKSNIYFKGHNLDISNSTRDIVRQFNLLQYDNYCTLMYIAGADDATFFLRVQHLCNALTILLYFGNKLTLK